MGEMYFIEQNVKNAEFVSKWPHSLLSGHLTLPNEAT